MPDVDAPATDYALALLKALSDAGVHDVVVCPGSRSQALALAAARLEAEGALQLHVRTDERSAAFFALGLGVETGAPAAVVTTSGTAVANLHPAVLEAHHQRVPLIVLSADRPAELRGIRSNQTTVQPGIFGGAVRFERDVAAPEGAADEGGRAAHLAVEAVRSAIGRPAAGPGPVHLNVAFREPLSGTPSAASVPQGADRSAPVADSRHPGRGRLTLEPGPRTVVIAGDGAGADAEELAHRGSWPLLAEVTSGARFGRNLVPHYRELLREDDLGGRIERAVVLGHPTLSREVPQLLQRDDVEAIVVAPTGIDAYNPGRRAQVVGEVAVGESIVSRDEADRSWLGQWVTASRALMAQNDRDSAPSLDDGHSHDPAARLRFAKDEFAAIRARVDRRMLVEELWRVTWPHDRLVFAASRLIREADAVVGGKKIPVHANRGLAGIDGTIATAHGIALGQQRAGDPGVTRVVVGDLALLHDAGSLLGGHGESSPRLQVIVGNDGGGTIFDSLEVAGTADPEVFDRVQYTPQSVDVAALAAAYGWEHVRAGTRSALEQALTTAHERPVLIEVPLDR